MGYCWTSGECTNGIWNFKMCDGRRTDYCGTSDKNRCCIEFCKTKKQAIRVIETYDNQNKE